VQQSGGYRESLAYQKGGHIVVGQNRKTRRYTPYITYEDVRLTIRIIELAIRYCRYGYRRITVMLKNEDWQVDHKGVDRVRKKEGFKFAQKQANRGQKSTRQTLSPRNLKQ
jgi:hypothetical protein